MGPAGATGARSRSQAPPKPRSREGAAALVVDVGGPVSFVVETDDLRELAAGAQLVKVVADGRERYGWARPGG